MSDIASSLPPHPSAHPWQTKALSQILSGQAHAWILSSAGPDGLNEGLAVGLAAAKSWLCGSPLQTLQACQTCDACRLVQAKTHPDLRVLMPEVMSLALGFPLDERSLEKIEKKERKPSKDIRIDAVRETIAFAQQTSSRGRGLVCVIHAAERLNTLSANALLKTLEEPAGLARFVLIVQDAHALLPTLRSRCQLVRLQVPDQPEPPHLVALIPPISAGVMTPAMLPAPLRENMPALVRFLQKLCHDALCVRVGGKPRFFTESASVLGQRTPSVARLSAWGKNLNTHARNAEHTFNAALMQEALLSEAMSTLMGEALDAKT